MKEYLIFCGIAMFVYLFRVYAEIAQFRKNHPGVQFKRICFSKTVMNFLQIIIMFLIPPLNGILLGFAIFGSDKVFIQAIEDRVLHY